MKTYTVRLRHDSGIVAITTTASDWMQAVKQCLSAEGAPSSAYLNCYEHFQAGDTVWSGKKINRYIADAYNRVNDHIHAWQALGKEPPEHLLNGRHNLLANIA